MEQLLLIPVMCNIFAQRCTNIKILQTNRKFGIKSRFFNDIFWLFLQFSNNVFMILIMSFGTFATLIIIRKKRKDYIP